MPHASAGSADLPLGSDCYEVPCPRGNCSMGGGGRYQANVAHQNLELTYPIVDQAVHRRAAPRVVWWRMNCLPLTWAVLNASLPYSQLVCEAQGKVPPACAVSNRPNVIFRPHGTPPRPFPIGRGRSATALRRAVYSSCGLRDDPPVRDGFGRLRLRVRFLERERAKPGVQYNGEKCPLRGAGTPSKRQLTSNTVQAIKSSLTESLEIAGAHVHEFQTVHIPVSHPGSLCDQAERFANADILISVHGAHLTNAVELRPKSVLVEVLPWANFMAVHYQRLAAHVQDISYVPLCARRPRNCTQDTCRENEMTCAASQRCREMLQNCFELEPVLNGSDAERPCQLLWPTLLKVARMALELHAQPPNVHNVSRPSSLLGA